MADQKITQLTALASAASTDVLPIVDVANTETKKITKADLLNGLQAELVSGTNIKTINSTSLLGSGDIAISANPAGTSGQIQFNDSSAFGADSNLFWDNTNKRLGVGTSSPSASIQCTTFTSTSITDNGTTINLSPSYNVFTTRNVAIGAGDLPARLGVKGSGSTSATTSLLVQNSSGTELLKVQDDGRTSIGQQSSAYPNIGLSGIYGGLFLNAGGQIAFRSGGVDAMYISASLNVGIGTTSPNASAQLDIASTTKGFLPPRMTTTQKNAISSPAEGLMVMDITTHKLCVYDGTSWVDLH